MAVRVRVQGEWIEHAEGDSSYVSDGHLHVTKWDGANDRVVAIYTPGIWKRVEVETAKDA